MTVPLSFATSLVTNLNLEASMKSQRTISFVMTAAVAIGIFCLQIPAASASSEGGFERSLTVTGPVDLDLTTGSGDVRITSGAAGTVKVSARIKATKWFGGDDEERIRRIEANPPIQQSGNTIRIGHIDSDLGHNISISYEVVVPSDTRLHAHTGSGDQTISGIQGQVEVETGSGNLKLSNLGSSVRAESGSGDLDIRQVRGVLRAKTGSGTIHAYDVAGGFEAHTGSGSVEVEQTSPGSARVSTGSGDVELRGVKGSLEAEAGSGSIHVEGQPTGGWTLHTGSGEVRLKLLANASFDLDAYTSSGSINVGLPITVQGQIGRKEVRGKVGGGGIPMVVRTGSGDIEIE